MSAMDYLGMYAEGWSKGDAKLLQSAMAEDYTLDDPNTGSIPKNEMTSYLDRMKDAVASLSHGILPDPFMELTEVVTQETEGRVTAWCWWSVPGTHIKGAGLIKVGPQGVESETLTYYTKLT